MSCSTTSAAWDCCGDVARPDRPGRSGSSTAHLRHPLAVRQPTPAARAGGVLVGGFAECVHRTFAPTLAAHHAPAAAPVARGGIGGRGAGAAGLAYRSAAPP